MRRRPSRTPAGENPVKVQQQELTRSVNQELARLESLRHDCLIASEDLEHIIEKSDGASKELEGKLEQIASANGELAELGTRAGEAVKNLSAVNTNLVGAKKELADKVQEAANLINQARIDAEKIISSAQVKVESITAILLVKQGEFDVLQQETSRKKIELNRIITDTQNESVMHRKLAQEVEDRKRDLVNLQEAIVKQESRLAEVQESVRQEIHLEAELQEKIRQGNETLRAIDAQIELKKAEEEGLHERILSVTRKEDHLRELAQQVKDLYAKSGITIDIQI